MDALAATELIIDELREAFSEFIAEAKWRPLKVPYPMYQSVGV